MRKFIYKVIIAAILLATPFLAQAVNDVTINGIVNFQILTADTAVLTTVIASAPGQVTLLDVQSNYIDITLDNLSSITFNTTAPSQYIRISKIAGSNNYTIAPSCPTTNATLTGTGATVTLRLQIYTTNNCHGGGGVSHVFPTNYFLTINENNTCTSSRNVILNLQAEQANSVVISNNSDFIGAQWESFTNPLLKSWLLESGDGIKTVYAIFRSVTGDLSPVVSDSIQLKSGGCEEVTPPPPPSPPSGSGSAQCTVNFKPGELLKSLNSTTVYYLGADCKRYIFPNEKTYLTWYNDFKNVKLVSDDLLAQISWGRNITYKPGIKMVKLQSTPEVYAVDAHGTLRWIISEEIAAALYGKNWAKMVEDLPDSFFTDYKIGEPIRNNQDFDPASVSNNALDIIADLQIGSQ